MKIYKLIYYRFNDMYPPAAALMQICLFIILISVSFTYIYIDAIATEELFWLWCERSYIAECIISSILCSLAGGFLLDIASVSEK